MLRLPRGSQGLKVTGKIPTHAAFGEKAILACDYEPESGIGIYSVKWYKDGKEFYRYEPWHENKNQFFSQPGVKVDATASTDRLIVLKSVNHDTSGKFKCEVSAERPSYDTVAYSGDLLVVVVPEGLPQITGLQKSYRIGDNVRINCTSAPSKPAASLIWYINDKKAPDSYLQEYPPFEVLEKRLEKSVLGMNFTLEQHHFRDDTLEIACTATVATIYWQSVRHSVQLPSTYWQPPPRDPVPNPSTGQASASPKASLSFFIWLKFSALILSFLIDYLFS
ncbi:unnamed protein product [Cyprideis torosa]|uniref:Uncharacterized protein n=1 Tax=Cyprideis torosa TaxID=163714 RepID=A0A7R8W5V2_9CRUS|nr:unnamed protein product [Cyprideis torosa]CAG0885716.1 unnamed protein product [Cyprideis torosa]